MERNEWSACAETGGQLQAKPVVRLAEIRTFTESARTMVFQYTARPVGPDLRILFS
jgi:hypothetical protein